MGTIARNGIFYGGSFIAIGTDEPDSTIQATMYAQLEDLSSGAKPIWECKALYVIKDGEWVKFYDHELRDYIDSVSDTLNLESERIDYVEEDVRQLKQDIVNLQDADSQLSESIVEISDDVFYTIDNSNTGVIEREFMTDRLSINGILDKNGVVRAGTGKQLVTDFIKVHVGDLIIYKLAEDFALTYGLCFYSNADEKTFTYGVSTGGDAEHSYVNTAGTYTVTQNGYMRAGTLQTKPILAIGRNSKNADVVETLFGKISTGHDYADVTESVFENYTNAYISGSGDNPYSSAICSDFIPVEYGDKYKFDLFMLYDNKAVWFYNENRELIQELPTSIGRERVTGEFEVMPQASYIRVCSFNYTTEPYHLYKLKDNSISDAIDRIHEEVSTIGTNVSEAIDKVDDVNRMVNGISFPDDFSDITGNLALTSGYINQNGSITETSVYVTTEFIDILDYDTIKAFVNYGWNACGYVLFDDAKKSVYALKASTGVAELVSLSKEQILSEYPNARYIRLCGYLNGSNKLYVLANSKYTVKEAFSEILKTEGTGNVLFGKKIAFCGDSFTEASNLGADYYDNERRCYKSFGWRIAVRNKMDLYHDGRSGSTMHVVNSETPTERNPFAYQRYKNVPSDCDYIILQFGLNESNIANDDATKGTKSSTDVTTMWGSWNTVLEYLITNHPVARIGVIMSDAWMPQSYYLVLKEICEWWGIPLLDLGGDPNVPLMNGGRRNGSGLTLNPAVAKLRNNTFYTDPVNGDSHPNDAGHEWRSTVIENWIRSL